MIINFLTPLMTETRITLVGVKGKNKVNPVLVAIDMVSFLAVM